MYPLVEEITYQDPLRIFKKFADQNGSILLDSAELRDNCGRYSFIATDPFLILMDTEWQDLKAQFAKYHLQSHADLPPFQGGIAGFLSYDFHFENITSNQQDDMHFPKLAFGFYDVVLGFDHDLKRAWIFSSGFPETNPIQREIRAKERIASLLKITEKIQKNLLINSIQSNFTKEQYCAAVEKVKDYILAGDIFQANISQRFSATYEGDLFQLYSRLREKKQAPFSAFLRFNEVVLASASPERFLKVKNGNVETRPIKGTRARGKSATEDAKLANELLMSEKDKAENIMIVDLQRNDLSRVCEPESVAVPQLCGLESYQSVHHLVSVVQGKLRSGFSPLDLLAVAFPGGSITGAPKIRAMEIIAEIEPVQRGPYCGCIGYVGFDGSMDTSIVIRTFAINNNHLTFQVGGAVTIDSDPRAEYEETLIKARLLLDTVYDFSD